MKKLVLILAMLMALCLGAQAEGSLKIVCTDFPCYDLALKSMEMGDNYPCAMNGAGEVAVHAFLNGKIPFLAIADVMAYAIEKTARAKADCIETLVATDTAARAYATEYIVK